jgi:hypothetical protein
MAASPAPMPFSGPTLITSLQAAIILSVKLTSARNIFVVGGLDP